MPDWPADLARREREICGPEEKTEMLALLERAFQRNPDRVKAIIREVYVGVSEARRWELCEELVDLADGYDA